jgi:hypothetical protein
MAMSVKFPFSVFAFLQQSTKEAAATYGAGMAYK